MITRPRTRKPRKNAPEPPGEPKPPGGSPAIGGGIRSRRNSAPQDNRGRPGPRPQARKRGGDPQQAGATSRRPAPASRPDPREGPRPIPREGNGHRAGPARLGLAPSAIIAPAGGRSGPAPPPAGKGPPQRRALPRECATRARQGRPSGPGANRFMPPRAALRGRRQSAAGSPTAA